MQSFLLKAATGAIAALSLAEHASALEIKAKSKGCPYGYGKENLAQEEETVEADNEQFKGLASIFEGGIETSDRVGLLDYEAIFGDMAKKFDSLSRELGGNKNERGSFVGCVLRLAGHDFMDYRDGFKTEVGGSDGCIDLNADDNRGIESCIAKFGITQMYTAYRHRVSLADFIVIIAEAAMARAHRGYDPEDPFKTGSLAQKFRDGFKFGRQTRTHCPWSADRMPNPENGCHGRDGGDGLEQIFVNNIFKGRADAWTLVAAINGAHTVGGAVIENSGYSGHWGTAEEQGIFNNDYYRSLVAKGWIPEVAVNNNAGKNQWKRADQPYNETVESLALSRSSGGAMSKLPQNVYDLHVERIKDPKRGNYENPVDGIKGHHEMMLTSDMCLVYKKNETHMKCMLNKGEHKIKDWRGHVLAQRMLDCRSNFWWEEFATDLYPETAGGCCAWASQNQLAGFGFQKEGAHPVTGKPVEMCGLQLKDRAFLNTDSCCFNAEKGSKNECSEKYYQLGPAYEDIVQFSQYEDVWIRKFLEAWHIGTENGMSDLKWLEPENAHDRLYLTDDHKVNCRGLTYPECFRTSQCDVYTVSQAPEASHHTERACRNKFMLLSEQQHPGETFTNYREQYQATLLNPTSSSDLNEFYPASNPLHRQDRVELKKQGKDWWTRSMPRSTLDSTTDDPNNLRAKTSCAITKAVSATQPEAWWQASFKEGDLEISEVEIWGEHYHTIWDRAMLGVEVYIGDQLCNTIDDKTITEIFETMNKKEGNGFRVLCNQLITGNSVKLVSKNKPRTGEKYTAGLTLCDIRVFTAKEPVWNGHYGLDGSGVRDFDKYRVRPDYGELLQNTSFGKGRNYSMWDEGSYDVEDRN